MTTTTGKVMFNGVNTSELPAEVGVTVSGGALLVTLNAPLTYGVVDLTDNTTTVLNAAGYLVGAYCTTVLSAHDCLIKNGAATVFTLPANWAVGSYYDFGGVYFDTSIVVDPNDSATGGVTLVYRAA